MEQLSFTEKLGVLGQNILAHPFFICILLIPVFLIFFNKKITKKAVVLIYVAVLLIVLFVGNTTIFALFDNLMDQLFLTLYFPNFVTLFLVEVISAIICLVTFIKKDITKTSKIINITSFAIIQTLFVLILTVIQANDIDIYKENALYANNDVLTLMQLLMGTFALQILTLAVIKAIDKVTERLDAKEKGEVFERQIRLPEGRITHAKFSEKVIIRKPQIIEKEVIKEVVKEPKVIEKIVEKPVEKIKIVEKPVEKIKIVEKQPEIKLDPVKPIKPLDKTLIGELKINPLDLNEEIIKDKNKPKPEKLISGTKKIKEPKINMKPIKPLDKTLINELKINPLDLNAAISKEKQEPLIEGIKKAKIPKLVEEPKPTTSLDIDQIVTETLEKERISTALGNKIKQYINKTKEKITKAINSGQEYPEVIPAKPLEPKINDIINESEEILREITKEPQVINEGKSFKFVNPEKINNQKPDLLKPMAKEQIKKTKPKEVKKSKLKEEILTPVKTLKPKEKELITNLQIIDFDKTVKAIKDLKIVYTL